MAQDSNAAQVASGVQTLIERLREEGVSEGRRRAERIVAEAEARAAWILEQANAEAQQLLNHAKMDASNLERSSREALHIAARDAVLQLKTTLVQRFQREVRRVVGEELERRELLQRLIVELAGQARETAAGAERVEMLLPAGVQSWEELQRRPDELEKGALTHVVRLIAGEALREGITFVAGNEQQKGISLRLVDEGVTIDLTDKAVAELLLAHLQPRFRALLEGIVR